MKPTAFANLVEGQPSDKLPRSLVFKRDFVIMDMDPSADDAEFQREYVMTFLGAGRLARFVPLQIKGYRAVYVVGSAEIAPDQLLAVGSVHYAKFGVMEPGRRDINVNEAHDGDGECHSGAGFGNHSRVQQDLQHGRLR